MSLTRQTILLFILNFIDGVLTIYWVRNGFATEGNHLMATLLDVGDIPFLTVKVIAGATAAFVLAKWCHYKMARYGLTLVLGIYLGLMAIHFLTGLSAAGIVSDTMINEFSGWSGMVFAMVC